MASILSITNIYLKEQKRKNRWTLRFNGVPVFNDPNPLDFNSIPTSADVRIMTPQEITDMELSLLTASRPQLSIGEVEFHRLNEKYYYPEGKATYEPMEVSFYDTIGLNAGRYLYGWFRAVFDFKTGAVGYKKNFVAEGILSMLDPKGTVIEQWRLINCWPTNINFNDLSYEDTGAAMVNTTIRYDRALPTFYEDYMPDPPSTQGMAGNAFGIPGQNAFNQIAGVSVSDFPGGTS